MTLSDSQFSLIIGDYVVHIHFQCIMFTYTGTGGSVRSVTKPTKGEKEKDKKGDTDKKRE